MSTLDLILASIAAVLFLVVVFLGAFIFRLARKFMT